MPIIWPKRRDVVAWPWWPLVSRCARAVAVECGAGAGRPRGWLVQRYATRGMSAAEIAAEIGRAEETVRRALVRHEIPRRTLNEARRLQHVRNRARSPRNT